MSEKCKWKYDEEYTTYDTDCGKSFLMVDDYTLEENEMKYCCYCGKEIEEVMTRNDFLDARW